MSKFVRPVVLSLGLIFVTANPVLAQREEPAKPAVKGYTLQYVFTGLLVVLGVFVACRPGTRGKTAKLERGEDE
ncbi:MAG: hypothetical protein SFX18_06510 [Pirellulales bacterium]|nr:hypothetical protein [Pirellulales bacterium]